MKWLTLDYIHAHSRINFECEDSLLELYGDAAEETIADYLNRGDTVDDCVASLTAQYGRIPVKIYYVGLLLVEASYTYRTPVSPTNMSIVPYNFDFYIKPYMKL